MGCIAEIVYGTVECNCENYVYKWNNRAPYSWKPNRKEQSE